MKMKEKLLRVRPFNMANFSGGAGYMPYFAMLAFLAAFPAALILWTGLATTMTTDDGLLDYPILKRRLKRVLLPICLILFIACSSLLVLTLDPSTYGGRVQDYWLSMLWAAAVTTIGIFFSMYLSAKLLSTLGKHLTKVKWFLCTLVFTALMLILGFFIFMVLVSFGDSLRS